jgi:hypothetical protein
MYDWELLVIAIIYALEDDVAAACSVLNLKKPKVVSFPFTYNK